MQKFIPKNKKGLIKKFTQGVVDLGLKSQAASQSSSGEKGNGKKKAGQRQSGMSNFFDESSTVNDGEGLGVKNSCESDEDMIEDHLLENNRSATKFKS